MTEDDAPKPGLAVRLAWLPVPLLLIAIILARSLGLHQVHDLVSLRLVLSFVFYTLVSLGTLFLVGRSFLASGAPSLLLLECGVILWSLAGTVGDAVYHGDPNINVTIFNTAMLLSGLCHLGGAALAIFPQRRLHPPVLWLVAAGAVTLGALWLVTHAALAGQLPLFFVSGQGGTAVRYGVLTSAIGAFVCSAALAYASQRTARLPFTSWYAPAMLLLAVGLFGVMVQLALGSVVNWLARVAQWLGGTYLLIAAAAALRSSQLTVIPLRRVAGPPLYREGIAIVVVVSAAAVRLVFLAALGTHAPFVTFYPAVLLATLYGGLRAGLVATLLSAVLADYFWILPKGVFAIEHAADWLAMVVFAISGALICVVADGTRRAQARAREAETKVRVALARQHDLEALRVAEERFVKAFQGNTAAMAITRLRDGVFIDVNDQWVEMNGFARADVLGNSGSSPTIWCDARDREELVRDLQRHGRIHNREFHFLRKSGERWTGLVSSQLCELEGEPAIISSIVDISERKHAEQALRDANARLQEADRHKNDFLAVLSHELRNPLAPIRNSLYVLERVNPGSQQAQRAITVIDRQAAQLVRLVDDLLDVTRINRGKIHLQCRRIDLNEIVRRTVEDQRSLLEAKDLRLELATGPGPLFVIADPERIAQVVGNLLQNAGKFSDRGGPVGVEVATDAVRAQAVIRVTDAGAGIAPDMLGRLFTAFVQADATLDRSKGGLGLGLALVKGLVELQGGEVSAASEGIGKGSAFTIRLPLLQEQAAANAEPRLALQGDMKGSSLPPSG